MQVLYPVALAAGIFSMQQEAIPFKQSPRSFVITVFTLIVVVYATLLFGKYALPLLARRIITLWVKERNEVGEVPEILVEDATEDALQPRKGLDMGRPLGDEENVIPKSLRDKSTSWTNSWKKGVTIW
jgi:hypothetical protein